jgi:hypothetical protein
MGCCADKACDDSTCMRLPPSVTCGDCVHISRCAALFGASLADTQCDFFPRRFLMDSNQEVGHRSLASLQTRDAESSFAEATHNYPPESDNVEDAYANLCAVKARYGL